MRIKKRRSERQLFGAIAVVIVAFLFIAVGDDNQKQQLPLTKRATQHILYGNRTGGGHLYGVGKPCKSEFPKAWDVDKVIGTVKKQAANNNIAWRQEDNGYHVSEKMHGNVRVRVVMDDDRSHIITAYPTNQPRNPCK